jgi:D-alanyl-D-alanine carboxypeptidase/cell division protein FtsN
MMRSRLEPGRRSGSMRNAWQAVLVVAVAFLPATVLAQPEVSARGAIIVDADTGAVIWERNADEPLPPASTTKVMTAILALQSHQLDEHFPVSENAALTPPSKIGLRAGQSVALRDLLYAVLLKSANDAAVVVAEGVAGSEPAFADRMNLKARVIGASQTNFVNPHGLTEAGHVTTARDLSRIFRYGLGVPGFREVLSTPSAEVPIDDPNGERLTLVRSHNRLLDFQVIGKTGYTRPARRCFVGAAGQGSREVVIAILGSNDLWGDARRMLDYGLSPSRPTPVLMAAGSAPPPPVPVLEEAPEPGVAVARAEPRQPAAELRAAPPPPPEPARPVEAARAEPPPEPAPPIEVARAERSQAPEAAVARASRMARARPDAAVPPPEPMLAEEPAARTADGDEPHAAQPVRAEPIRTAPPPPDPVRVAEPEPEPARTESPSEVREAPNAPRETIVPADREVAAGAAGTARTDDEPATPPPSAEPESPHGGVWADAPVRDRDERAATRPVREADDDGEPARRQARPAATDTARQRTQSTRATKETVADKHDGNRRTAKGTDEDTRGKTRAGMTRAERRRALAEERAEARAEAAEARRHAASHDTRNERHRGVTVIRASASDERPSRTRKRVLDDDDAPSKPAVRSRTRRSPEGDTEDAGHGAARGAGRSHAKSPEKDSQKYTVRLGPYRNRKAADTARADLSRLGYEARVVGQSLQLGNFADRGRADKLASRLRTTGHPATSTALR